MNFFEYVSCDGDKNDVLNWSSKKEFYGRASIVRTKVGGKLYVEFRFYDTSEDYSERSERQDRGAAES